MEDALYDCQLVLTTLGLALGVVAAGAVTRLMAGFLVDVSPTDPAVFTVTGLVLVGAALLARLVPSRRAAKADPLATLRVD